jgi:hypothetical protein
MKLTRYLRLFLTALTLGVFALAQARAAIAEFAGSYEAKLGTFKTTGTTPEEVFYGKLSFKVTNTGFSTGTLGTRAGGSHSFKTTLEQGVGSSTATNGNIGVYLIKGTKAFYINFSLTVGKDRSITVGGLDFSPGELNTAFFVADSFKLAQFTGTSVPEWMGNYTLALTNPSPSGATVPAGAGYASLSVIKTGVLTYKGKTGDGALITGTASPTAAGDYNLFIMPKGYAGGGYLSTVINLVELGTQAEPAVWTKPANTKDKAYPAGFSTVVDVIVQEWFVPAKKAFPLSATFGFAASKNFDVLFSGQGLSDDNNVPYLPKVARITGLSVIQAVSGGTGSPAENNSKEWNKLWNVKLNALTGVFTGTQIIRHLVGTKLVDRKVTVEGVLVVGSSVTKAAFAYGQYAVTAKSGASTVTGQVSFHGPLVDNTSVATAGNYTVKVDVDLAEIVTVGQGDGIVIDKPTAPKGSPKDGQLVKFSISEDQQTLVFNGISLPYNPIGSSFGLFIYQKTTPKGMGASSVQVTIYRSITTGLISGVSCTIIESSVLDINPFKTRSRTSTIFNQNPISTTLIKL